jgi:hypothetical protein
MSSVAPEEATSVFESTDAETSAAGAAKAPSVVTRAALVACPSVQTAKNPVASGARATGVREALALLANVVAGPSTAPFASNGKNSKPRSVVDA